MACIEGIIRLFTIFYLHRESSIFLRNDRNWKKHVRLSFQSPFSFLFCAKTTKIIFTKFPLRMSWRNTSECRFSPPSHFFFVRKRKKLCWQKIRLRMTWRNTSDLFSVPPGKFFNCFQTFRQSYLLRFFKVCDKCDIACNKCDIACDIACNKFNIKKTY